MNTDEIGAVLKRFEAPDEVREMELGSFEVVRIGGMTLGRATYQPGWRWSEHVDRIDVEHLRKTLEENREEG